MTGSTLKERKRGERMNQQDFLLLMVMAAFFALGYAVIKRLGGFLENVSREEELYSRVQRHCLSIGFSDPLTATGLTGALEQFSKRYPRVEVRLRAGAEEELTEALDKQELDLIFLPDALTRQMDARFSCKRVWLEKAPVEAAYDSAAVEPVTAGRVLQDAVWARDGRTQAAVYFLDYLRGEGGAFTGRTVKA